jgi:hypothetical protein
LYTLEYNTASPDRQTLVPECRENENTYANIWWHCRTAKGTALRARPRLWNPGASQATALGAVKIQVSSVPLLAPHTNEPRDVPRCGALSSLQKPLQYKGVHRSRCSGQIEISVIWW